jgi:hypothetical protein
VTIELRRAPSTTRSFLCAAFPIPVFGETGKAISSVLPDARSAHVPARKPSAIAEQHDKRRPLELLRMLHERIEAWMLQQTRVAAPEQAPAGLRVILAACEERLTVLPLSTPKGGKARRIHRPSWGVPS